MGGIPVYVVVTRNEHLNDDAPANADGKQGAGPTGNTHVATATTEYVHGTN
jgi:hypothetical protein